MRLGQISQVTSIQRERNEPGTADLDQQLFRLLDNSIYQVTSLKSDTATELTAIGQKVGFHAVAIDVLHINPDSAANKLYLEIRCPLNNFC